MTTPNPPAKKNTRRGRPRKLKTIEEVRDLLGTQLPTLIQNAAKSYEVFCQEAIPEDAKGFAAHHAACKAALSHVEILTKLVRWAEAVDEGQPAILSEDEEIEGLLAGARAALKELEDDD